MLIGILCRRLLKTVSGRLHFRPYPTGVYSYPVDQAAAIAVRTVKEFCIRHPDDIDIVRFVLFDADMRRAYDHAIYEAEVNQE